MSIYIDVECKCHVSNPNGIYTEIPMPEQLNGKCAAYIEGFRVRPVGFTYVNEKGETFGPEGSSVSAWRDIDLLNEFQAQYEAQLTAAAAAYEEGVNTAYD